MAQSGFTPILIYGSTTTGNTPSASNLTTTSLGVELAINATDGKLFYKDNSGNVQVLATKATGTIGGSNTQVQYNSSGVLAGSANMTFNGTTLTLANDASISGLTVGKGLGSATSNTAVGLAVLATNTSGIANSGFGVQALQLNTTGSGNAAFGGGDLVNYNATLKQNTTGSNNSAFGLGAMGSNTTGSNNIGVGYQALGSNTTASNNTAVGYQAGYSNTTGDRHFFGGYQAGYSNTTGLSNTAIGYQAGYTNSTGATNAYFGNSAGYAATGDSNTFIGQQAGYLITSGAKNTVLGRYNGNQGGLDIRTASNYIVLSDGDGNPRGYWDNNGQLILPPPAGSGNTITAKASNSGTSMFVANTSITSGTAYYAYFIYNGSATGQITSTGSVTLFTSLSDQRLKENIVDAGSGLEKLANVKVRSFDWKKNQEKTDFGLVAQELNEVAPEAVVAGVDKEDGSIDKPWQVDSSALVPAMIKAIQELNAKVTALEAQLAAK